MSATVVDARFCKPLDTEMLRRLAREHPVMITVEEGSIGGFAAHVMQARRRGVGPLAGRQRCLPAQPALLCPRPLTASLPGPFCCLAVPVPGGPDGRQPQVPAHDPARPLHRARHAGAGQAGRACAAATCVVAKDGAFLFKASWWRWGSQRAQTQPYRVFRQILQS